MPDEITVKIKESIQRNNPQPMGSIITPIDPILKGFFRVDESSLTNKQREKIEEISDYLGEISDLEKIQILKDIRYKLGSPRLGISEADNIHKYIKIKNSIKEKESELLSMEE